MTTSAILKAIYALPIEEQMRIVEKVVHALRVDKAATPKRKMKKAKPDGTRPESPSPSGDPWYDDPRNVAIVMDAIKKSKNDKGKEIVLKTKEDIKQYMANR